MKTLRILLASLLFSGTVEATKAPACDAPEITVIATDARCVDQGGVSIGNSEAEDAKAACLESKAVLSRCGPDGNITRLRAFQAWLKKIKTFEDQCTAEGGTFSYDDPNFTEPANESFCGQAVPEISSNMFEESLCNFHSECPAVKVVCSLSCS